jgi:hypothetical protein
MTNSETQTEPRKRSRKRATKASPPREAPAASGAPDTGGEALTIQLDKGTARLLARTFFVLLLAGGWLGILSINRWHIGPPVVFLWAGWLGVLLTARYLWVAGMSAAYDDESGIDEEEFWRPVGAEDELLREKRSLLKAIKEIEFDREMGKLSDKDAAELTRFYRMRAIELIKALESKDQGGELSIEDKIEREVKARLSVASASAKAKAETVRAKGVEKSKTRSAKARKAEKAAQAAAEPEAEEAGAEEAGAEEAGAEEARTEAEEAGAEEAGAEEARTEAEEASEADAVEPIAVAASEEEPRASAEVAS